MITTQSTLLKKVASVFNGKTPSKAEQRNTGHPVLKIKDVDAYGRFIGQYDSFVDDDVIKKNSGKLLLGNETLILNAAHNADYVGRKVFFSEPDVKGALPTGEWLIVRANEAVLDAKFAHYWIQSDRVKKKIKGLVKGIHLYPKDVAELEINLPPLDEQKRIAGILHKADGLRRKRAESLKLLDELLRATFLDKFGDPMTNPKGWPVRELADVVRADTIVTYGIVQAGPNYPGGVPYIRTGDIKHSKILERQLMRADPEIASKFKRSEVHTGDLVMSIRATVGTIAMVPPSLNGANLTQGTAKISPGPDLDGQFLFSYISSEGSQNWIQRHVKGATFREITLSKLREMPVYVPDKNSQRKFREIADQYEKAKDYYAHFAKESDMLFNALVVRAFNGELKSC